MALNGKHDIGDAFTSLKPGAEWSITDISDYTTVTWLSEGITQPTESEVNTEITRRDADYVAKEYQRKRGYEYPDFGTQLDYIYHNGLEKWKTDIVDPVKAKYPKPS